MSERRPLTRKRTLGKRKVSKKRSGKRRTTPGKARRDEEEGG